MGKCNYKSFLKQLMSTLFPVLFILGIAPIFPCYPDSLFDADEDPAFYDDDIEIPKEYSGKKEPLSRLAQLFDDATFTLGFLFSHGTDGKDKIIDNQTFLRIEYDTLIKDNLFFKLDGKSTFHLKNDHIADAKDRFLFIDPDIRETYLQLGFENLNLTVGKQISVWGKADTAAITDVVSPRDLSQFMFVELEDARSGQWMVSSNIYSKPLNTFLFVSPLPGTDTEPTDGSRYHAALPGATSFSIQKDKPRFGDLEYGLKLSGTFSKTDISLMAGRFFSNAAVYDYQGYMENGLFVLEKTYPDFFMAGGAVSHAWQSFLFKLELAYKNHYPLQGITSQDIYVIEKKDLIDAAAGVEYNANDKYQINLELSNRYISKPTGLVPGTDENSTALYATISKDFLNQTLNFEYTFYHHIQERNRFHRFQLIHDLTDNIQIKTDYTFFNIKDENSYMWIYRNEDRVGLEIQYSF